MIIDGRFAFTASMRHGFSFMFTPLQYVVDWPSRTIEKINLSVAGHQTLVNENIKLKYQRLLLQAKLQKLNDIQRENKQLKKLLHYDPKTKAPRLLMAELLAVKMDPYRQQILLDKGKKHGVFNGQPVLDAQGIMGQIMEVGPITSTVLLITDVKSAIPVKSVRTGERAILIGSQDKHRLTLVNLPKTTTIREGDSLVTSGLGQRFPEGYPVGKVLTIKKSDEAFIKAEVIPHALVNRSRLVLLLWPDKHRQQYVKELKQRYHLPKESS